MMPTFRYDKLTATSYRVTDAHSREEYGTVSGMGGTWHANCPGRTWDIARLFLTRDDAAHALYAARHAHGFEAGAL